MLTTRSLILIKIRGYYICLTCAHECPCVCTCVQVYLHVSVEPRSQQSAFFSPAIFLLPLPTVGFTDKHSRAWPLMSILRIQPQLLMPAHSAFCWRSIFPAQIVCSLLSFPNHCPYLNLVWNSLPRLIWMGFEEWSRSWVKKRRCVWTAKPNWFLNGSLVLWEIVGCRTQH